KGAERRCMEYLAQDLQAFDIGRAIDFGCEIVDPYFWGYRRIGAPDAQRTAAFRPQLAYRGRKCRVRMQLFSHPVGAERQEVDLYVRRRKTRIGLEEGPGGTRGDGQRALAKRRILQSRPN